MAKDSNTLKKTEAPKGEHPVKEKAEEKQVDIREKLTPEEEMKKAERLVALEEGKEKKTEEPGKEPKEEKPGVELAERYKGKSAEELIGLLDEKEKYIQGRSDEIGELRKSVEESKVLSEKVAKIEEETMKQTQAPGKLPERPQAPVISDDEYYNDPPKAMNKLVEYNKKLADYVDKITSAKTAPFYQGDMERRREKLYKDLEEKYKDFPVKFDRNKVQEFLNKNPEYFNQYKTKAYEQAYHDLSAEDYKGTREKENKEMREKVEKEVIEKIKTGKQAGEIGLSDLETPSAGGAPEYDADRMEEDPEYRDKVIADMEERKRKGQI